MKKNPTNDLLKRNYKIFQSKIRIIIVMGFMAMTISCTVAYVPTINPEVPNWAPAYNNSSNAQYYYLPDIECYYDLVHRDYIYLENNQWVFTTTLPSSYDWYDMNSCYTVVLDARVHEPWTHFSYYVSHYPRYYYRTYYKNSIQNNKRVWGFNENDKKEVYSHHVEQANEGQHYYNGENNNNTPQHYYQSHYNNQGNEQHNGNQYQNNQGYVPQNNNQSIQGQNINHQNGGQYNNQNTTPANNSNYPHQNGQTTGGQNTNPITHPQNGGQQTGQANNTPNQGQGGNVPHQNGQAAGGQTTPHQNGQNGNTGAGQTTQGQYQTELPATEQPHPNRFNGQHTITPPTPTEPANPVMNNNQQGGHNQGANNTPGQNQTPLPATEQPHPAHGGGFQGTQVNSRPALPLQLNDKNVGRPVKVKKDMLRPQP